MSNNWQEIAIKTTVKVSEALSEFMLEHGSDGVVIDKNEEDEVVTYYVTLKAYFTEKEDLNAIISDLNTYLELLAKNDNDIGSGEVSINQIKSSDWENDWKQYFDAFKVGKNLVIKPTWSEYDTTPEDIIIPFDPGGFFGTTPHPSTRLCLEEIEDIASDIKNPNDFNVLDLGTGSGILSLALYHLGFKKITAIDIDPVAIRTSEDNFALNNMSVELFLGELKDCHEKYDFIAGNLLAEIIEELADEIAEKLNKNGLFIGAGITKQKETDIEKALEKVGIKIIKKRYFEEWLCFRAIKL